MQLFSSALARDLTDGEARELAREGRAVVWIDSGLHSSEVAHAQHAPLLAHHMATDDSDETRRIRDDVVLLLMPVMNLDGQDIVVDWQFELPLRDATAGIPADEFFIPGSIVRIEADSGHPVSQGMPDQVGAFSMERRGSRSQAFDIPSAESPGRGMDVAARYASEDLAVSGLVVGVEHIGGKPAVVRVAHGDGQLVLFGFRPQFRAQPSGTYKMLFNAIHASAVEGLPRPGSTKVHLGD